VDLERLLERGAVEGFHLGLVRPRGADVDVPRERVEPPLLAAAREARAARPPEIWSSIATSSAHPERARRGQHDAELTDAQAACLHRHEEIEQGAALKRRRARPNLRDGGGA